MAKWIDHIVVRVNDIDESLKDYESKLGMKASEGPDAIPEMGMTRAILPLGDEGRFIELAEPLGEGGAIAGALEKYGEGVHLLDHPLAWSLLTRACSPDTAQPEFGRLVGRLYQLLAEAVLAAELPRERVDAPTRMAANHREAVYRALRWLC